MRILQINTRYYNGGSTGRITYDLKCVMDANGIESYVAFGFGYDVKPDETDTVYRMENDRELFVSKVVTKLIGHHGFNNACETQKLLRWIDAVKPDLIHMHNIHNHYVNIELLLSYMAKKNIPCVLTMHDCWTFTGHCAYFDYSGCRRWKTGCHHCPSLKDYPKTFAVKDPSPWNYRKKKELFAPLNITFVSPSQWLAGLQQQSFLKDKPCVVINNGVDTNIFKPAESNIRDLYGIGGRKMILAVAAGLAPRKGRKFMLELPELLNDDEVLVVVGLNKGQERLFSQNGKVVCIYRTKTADELVSLYSAADVFINPTLEDNFPTTNIEALACGTPVVTFDTGGSIEAVLDSEEITEDNGIRYTSVGAVVSQRSIESFITAIRKVMYNGEIEYTSSCRNKATKYYEKTTQYNKYIELYIQILSDKDNA